MPPAPLTRFVSPDAALHELEYAVVDVETTGRSSNGVERVIEVAAVVVRAGRLAESFTSLVNPRQRIPPVITRLTGITNTMVSRAPDFSAVADAFAAPLRGRVFVAHNAMFDWAFVTGEFERTTGEVLKAERLCTVRLARRLLAHLPRRNLDAVAAHYDIRIENRHRAFGDAHATAQVFARMLDELGRQGVHTWRELNGLLSGRKRARARQSALPSFMTDWRIA